MTTTPHVTESSKPITDEQLRITAADQIVTAIDKDTVIEGSISTRNGRGLLIFGEVRNGVQSEGTVVIAEGGLVSGPIHANRLVVAGTIAATANDDATNPRGIHAATLLEALPTAKISAHLISYGEIEAQRGAQIHGRLEAVPIQAAAQEPARNATHPTDPSWNGAKVTTLPVTPVSRPRLDSDTQGAPTLPTAVSAPSAPKADSAAQHLPPSGSLPSDLTLDLPDASDEHHEVSFALPRAAGQ